MAWTEVDSVIFLEETGWAVGAALGPHEDHPRHPLPGVSFHHPRKDPSVPKPGWLELTGECPRGGGGSSGGWGSGQTLHCPGKSVPSTNCRVHPIPPSLLPKWPSGSNSYWGRSLRQRQIVRKTWGPQSCSGGWTMLSPVPWFLPRIKTIF